MSEDNNIGFFEFVSSASNEGFRYVNYETGYVIASKKFRELLGIKSGDEGNDMKVLEAIYPEDLEKFKDALQTALGKRKQNFEAEYRVGDGSRWILHNVTNRYDKEGNVVERFCFFHDITEEKKKQADLEYVAYFDPDTGVYNRNYFIKRLDKALKKNQKSEFNKIQVMYINIDNYNVVTDSIGFETGDELLINFAKLLTEYSSSRIKIGRFKNDEFAIAIYDADNENEIIDIYNDISKKIEKPFKMSDGNEVYISISVGITTYPKDGNDASDLIKCADIAMYNVKKSGKNSMCLFEKSMLDEFIKNVKMENDLKVAVEKLDFVLNYQPQYYSEKKELRGVEALVRWKIDENQYVNPGEFIPMAEKNGCILNIGKWVIKQALDDFVDWKMNYGYNGMISINISAIQLKDEGFLNYVLESVEERNVVPSDVEIEITESVLIENFSKTRKILEELRRYGFKVALDDFGTGYSSLSYLKNIPIDTLKIDKSFVDNMLLDNSTGIITDALIKMVKKLGLETIAEGVETKEQYDCLKKMNCDNIQGFLLGKPMTSGDMKELITKLNESYK